jgi:hypothetical protein
LVEIKVNIPTTLDPNQKDKVEELAASLGLRY